MAGWAQVFRFNQRLGDCKVKRDPGDTQRHWTWSIGPVQKSWTPRFSTGGANFMRYILSFEGNRNYLWEKTPGFYTFPWQSLSIRGNFRKVMQASGMVCLLQGWQLPSAGVAEAPAATSCYSPQIHWVSVRAKSGEFSPNIQPPPNLSTLQQIQFWRSFFKYSSVSNFKTISLPFLCG